MAICQPLELAFNYFEPAQGIEESIPIIYLHGVTVSKEVWGDIPQVVANATGRKAYALDARNHGDSEWSEFFDFQINVDDLKLFLDNMKIEKAIIVGHSMGGMTAMKLALRAPERVEKLVVEDMSVANPTQKNLENTLITLKLAMEAIAQVPVCSSIDDAKKFIADYVYNSIPERLKPSTKYQSNDPHLILKQNRDGSYAFKCNIMLLFEKLKDADSLLTKYEGHFEGATCFIYGKNSPYLVDHDKYLIKQHFPNATMVGIEGAAHNVHAECPLPFAEALLNFLQGGWNKKRHK